jgi:multidrug transporter EmrE-like cation transporter
MTFILSISAYVVLNACGQLLIKMGTLEMKQVSSFQDLLNFKLLSGIGLFGLSFLTWIFIVSRNNLSYAFPFAVGLGYIGVIALSLLVLKESVTLWQFIGMALIWIGIVIMLLNKVEA